MDNVKKYNEALERARDYYKANLKLGKADENLVLEDIFPELAESKDEKIRKAIRGWIYTRPTQFFDGGFSKEEMLTWLEKQGNISEQWNEEDNEIVKDILYIFKQLKDTPFYKEDDRAENIINWIKSLKYRVHSIAELSDYDKDMLGAIKYCIKNNRPLEKEHISWLKKQGEQKPIDNVETKDYSSIDPHFGKPIDKMSADKVEPKFKNGQWIVWQDKCYKVNYNGCGYELFDQNGLSILLDYGTIDENAHLWDITKDAKPGDVLYSPTYRLIWIYKDECQYYVAVNLNYVDPISFDGIIVTPSDICPATKEQYEQLEKAMADAGYTFDFEKKELKKVEQKPYGQREECLDCQFNYAGKCKGFCTMKKDEQKSQRMISAEAKEALFDYENANIQQKDFAPKTKSKFRIGDSIKTANEEPLTITEITDSGYWSEDLFICNFDDADKWELVKQKSAWSEEDERERKRIIGLLEGWLSTFKETCYAEDCKCGIDWLKSLKDRYAWKPSDEQVKAFEHFVRSIGESGYASPYENNTKLLYSLLNDLKKLKG